MTLCEHFKMSVGDFVAKYCRWADYYYGTKVLALLEKKNYDCILWENGCSAYEARPIQCSTYPFWSWMIADEKTWNEVMKNETRMADSWEFLKWWVSADVQVRFGREMEALLGSSARYATANKEALKQLSWNSRQIKVLNESMEDTVGVPEVPGSYYTPRHIVNATRRVINAKDDARETLIDYTRKINEELTRKRQEFNLPVAED